jgi:hypothetical protein
MRPTMVIATHDWITMFARKVPDYKKQLILAFEKVKLRIHYGKNRD